METTIGKKKIQLIIGKNESTVNDWKKSKQKLVKKKWKTTNGKKKIQLMIGKN